MHDLKKIYELYIESKQNVCIDTRSKKIKNSIFFALKGTKYNGNLFAQEAIKKGAKYVIVDEPFEANDKRIIKVKNTLKTLQKLAIIHRSNWGKNKFVIGITGTNGKTTTKEILNQILSSSLNINSTKGNFNNHIGVPLTILALNNNHTGCIVELGANHQGEIKELCKIANPTHGIITNIGEAHLEGFKDVNTIIKTKNELYDYIKKNGGTIFVNKLDSRLVNLINKYDKVVFYSCEKKNEQNKKNNNLFYFLAKPLLTLYYQGHIINTKIIGQYNAQNLAASIKISETFNVNLKNTIQVLEKIELKNNRSQFIKTNNNEIILDAYNANPTSVKLAIENFKEIIQIQQAKNNNTIIIGDMLELGQKSNQYHQDIVKLIGSLGFKKCILIGENFMLTKTFKEYKKFTSLKKYIDFLRKEPIKNHYILIKGSRKMQLEKLINIL